MLKLVRRSFGAMRVSAFVLLLPALIRAQDPAAQDDLEIPVAPPATPRPPDAAAPPNQPPAPAASQQPGVEPEQDDLTLPSAPAPASAPSVAPPQPSPVAPSASAPPQPSPVAPSASAPPVAPPQPSPVAPPAVQPPDSATNGAAPSAPAGPGLRTGNLEVTAHSRPVPLGLVLSGFLQAEYVNQQLSEDQLQQDGVPLNRDELVLRAARLRVDGGYEYAAYTLELDASTRMGPALGIRRAEATLLYRGESAPGAAHDQRPPLIALVAGVTDLPFGYELVESSRTRLFMERSLGSEALFPTQMDVGVKLYGGWSFLRYAVALVNGQPVDVGSFPRDPNAAKDVLGRFGAEARVTESVVISGGSSFGFGKGFHAGRVAVKDAVAWRDDNNDGVAVPNEIIGVPGSAATPSESFERWALGLDLQLQIHSPWGATRLFAEAFVAQNHDRGLLVSDPVEIGFDLRQVGGYLAVTQDITPYALAGFRISSYDPSSDFFEERRGEIVPRAQDVLSLSPVLGLVLPQRARLLCQYDFIKDALARDARGIPTDAENNQLTLRLQVDL